MTRSRTPVRVCRVGRVCRVVLYALVRKVLYLCEVLVPARRALVALQAGPVAAVEADVGHVGHGQALRDRAGRTAAWARPATTTQCTETQ